MSGLKTAAAISAQHQGCPDKAYYWYCLAVGFFFFLFFGGGAPAAYGGSQASGQIGAIVAGRHHSHSILRSSLVTQWVKDLALSLQIPGLELPHAAGMAKKEKRALCFFFCLFSAVPEVYVGSQARGQIRAVATGLHHSHSKARSKLCLQPTPQLTATTDP